MGTKIEWTESTWNPIVGCSVVSPGCTNCYAMKDARRLSANPATPQYRGLTRMTKGGAVWTGETRLVARKLAEPLRRRAPTTYFVNSMSDLFHESVPDEAIDRVFAVMALTPRHTFQVLTKRSARMREYFTAPHPAGNVKAWQARVCQAIDDLVPERTDASRAAKDRVVVGPLANVWLGVSCEDQARADERRDDLRALAEAGWLTFVSYEPALGPIDWTGWAFLRWLISGGESGPKARPSHPDWHRQARDFCDFHGIAFFFKQWGEWGPVMSHDRLEHDVHRMSASSVGKWWAEGDLFKLGKKAAGRLLDGRTHDAMPEPRHAC